MKNTPNNLYLVKPSPETKQPTVLTTPGETIRFGEEGISIEHITLSNAYSGIAGLQDVLVVTLKESKDRKPETYSIEASVASIFEVPIQIGNTKVAVRFYSDQGLMNGTFIIAPESFPLEEAI